MHAAAGILTARGGMTSHAAVVARGWGKCCVSGCPEIRVNDAEKVDPSSSPSYNSYFTKRNDSGNIFLMLQVVVIGDLMFREGEWISLNGSTGEVILGKQPLSPPALSGDLETFMSWADDVRRIKVLHSTPTDRRFTLFYYLLVKNLCSDLLV